MPKTPVVKRKDVRLLWACGYWDGPQSGLCLFRGEKCWFEMVKESYGKPDKHGERGRTRSFVVLQLSEEEITDEEYWHELFRQNVGTHTEYDEHGNRTGEVVPVGPDSGSGKVATFDGNPVGRNIPHPHSVFYEKQEKERKPQDYAKKNTVLALFHMP